MRVLAAATPCFHLSGSRFVLPSSRALARRGLAVIWLLVAALSLIPIETSAQDESADQVETTDGDLAILESTISPNEISVGDRVEMRVVLRSNEPEQIELPEEYPSNQSVEIRSMRMIQRDDDREIRLVLSPFRTGTLTVPEIDVGPGTLSGARFRVQSVLPEDGSAELAPVKAPGFLPGFQVIALVLLVVLVSAPFALYRLTVSVVGRIGTALAAHRANRPFRLFLRSIREISTLFDSLNARNFYIRLVDDLRQYLSERLHPDFMVATANEVPFLLQGSIEDDAMRERINALFQRADLVKFASQGADSEQRRDDLETVVTLVSVLEERNESRVRRRAFRPIRRLAGTEAA